jgi:peptidoglycan/LPS O-acetylase OafA/YrhL
VTISSEFVGSRSSALTFKAVLDQGAGIAPGFDFVRLFLATDVLLWHAYIFAEGQQAQHKFLSGPLGPFVLAIVPAFFGLSGFLVTGSLLRLNSAKNFILFRALRIIPALLTEVTLSALILGPIVTEQGLPSYFANGEVWYYFTNIVGNVNYALPGVFEHQNFSTVNGALWTVPGEILCYATLLILMLIGISNKRSLMLAAFVVSSVVVSLVPLASGFYLAETTRMLVLCFYAGALLFHYRDVVPVSGVLAVACAILVYYAMAFFPGAYVFVGPICTVYVICFLGMRRLPRIPVLMDGDHSYGIYLYHCPILQTIVWATGSTIKWPALFAFGYVGAAIFAMFSWHFIEKPALALRNRFVPRRDQIVT